MSRARFPIEGILYRSREEADRLVAAGAWIRSTIGDVVRSTARRRPDHPYLIWDGEELTFAALERQTEILAAALLDLGLRPGDRALFQMGTVTETIIALFACFKAGVVPVCTLPQYREIEIGQLAAMSGAKAYFVQADFSATFDLVSFAETMARNHAIDIVITARGPSAQGRSRLEDLCASMDYASAQRRLATVEIDPEDVAVFQLSGGSTGIPKIVPRMHGEYLGQAASWSRRHDLGPTDVCLWPLPLIHNAAVVLIVLPSLIGGCSIVLRQRFDLEDFLAAIARHRVTYAGSIGPIAPRLLDYGELARHDLSTLRFFFALDRAGPLESHIGIPSANMFGITEGLLTSSAPTSTAAARHDTIGWPTSDLDEVRVLTPGGEEPVSRGTPGEFCFRGPHVLRGYYSAPEANAASFTSDGFLRSGDLVREDVIDGRSCYVFLGRMKDNISRGNEKFAAEEVERLIGEHPDVLEAKVVAMPDRYLGERACAFIIPRRDCTCPSVPELGEFLIGRGLAKYKLPERIEQVDAFPVTRVGKLDKAAMRSKIAAIIAAEEKHEPSQPKVA